MRERLAIIFITSLMLINSVAFGQDTTVVNLLENGDFEADFVTLEGPVPRNVAADWTPWHVPRTGTSPSFANHNPNFDEETDRVRLDDEGSAQKYFTLFATHQAGIYQEVSDLSSGTTYRFSIYAHVWSSSYDDLDESEDPGDVVVRVGIDPDGGTDGTSDDIIWSTSATFFYDAYRQYAVIATAASSSITVFVESTVGEPRANNYIYLDDAVLEVATETVVVEPSPTTETNEDLVSVDPNQDPSETPTATATETATATPTVSSTPPATSTATASPTSTATASDEPKGAEQIGGENNQRNAEGQQPVEPSETPTATATLTSTATPTATATLTSSPTETATASATATVTEVPSSEDGDEGESNTPITDQFPDTVVHVVVVDDTVSALAVQYDSTVDAINRANGLNQSNLIYVGQRLIIPVNLPETPPETAVTPTATPTATQVPTATPTPTATPVTYQILPGDTLEAIALLYGTTVDELVARNGIPNPHQIDVGQILVITTPIPPTPIPSPTPLATATPQPPSTSTFTYTVQAGDILSEIAASFNTTVAAIAQLNGITNPSRIFPGQVLQIPDASGANSNSGADPEATQEPPTPTPLPTNVPVTYTVQFGDSLYQIAAAYGVSIVELAQLNGITNYDQLSVGQVLTIPG